jgi:cyclopropane fatty-acyl-phospholipid synthase-like methyltransferase
MTPKEPQYQRCIELRDADGLTRLGLMSNQVWVDDPIRLVFVLSRYKFVAKMLAGLDRVLEIGCADAFGSRIVLQEVGALTVTDFDPLFIDDVVERMDNRWPMDARVHDILDAPIAEEFDAAYALDVIEHIQKADERRFVGNIAASLVAEGVCIIGAPSLQSQQFASPLSREGHVNCKEAGDLQSLLADFFRHVHVFSMNDEVVHTGFSKMAHYYLALCEGVR